MNSLLVKGLNAFNGDVGGDVIVVYDEGQIPESVIYDLVLFNDYFDSSTNLNHFGRLNTYTIKISQTYVILKSDYIINTTLTSIIYITFISVLSFISFKLFLTPLLKYVVEPLGEVDVVLKELDNWPGEVLEKRVERTGLETEELLGSLLGLASLLALALGRGGLRIYKQIASKDPEERNRTNPPQKVIFLFTDIRNFTGTVEILQDGCFRWLNNIAFKIHTSIGSNGGIVNLLDVRLGFGLTLGSAVLGGMGSDEKIDVNYVGVGGEAAEVLEGLTKFYGVFVLMDEGVWEGLEEKIREGCR
ncbi:hypothetical protein TL16_g02612 [Triparma laevis f. inornata]|uniref:Uncharacterized protein n=1 Tax=Triparma laevis f. inornata TaxID=1714386 RepID=A0A9W6ZZ35_9STRA|nr:hypothetical protein TL16_g02612 [Triparma laevis f. inornata]